MIKPINHDQMSLQQPSQPAQLSDLSVAHDLIDTLRAHQQECVGLAANMIGVHKRIIAVSFGPAQVALLNPQITKKQQAYQAQEGCLSLDGKRTTTRYRHITVQFTDIHGRSQVLSLDGFSAQIVQHEIDHCNGILI
jgi:peptide deformylase